MDVSSMQPFLDTPWTSQILQDPAWVVLGTPQPRYPGHDKLWYELLSGPGGVGARCMLCPRPQQDSVKSERETRQLLVLGSALTSAKGICHGGVLGVIMDEVGITTVRYYALDGGIDPATAFLNIAYKAPVPAPGIIMATAKIVEALGRKVKLCATIVGADGNMCVSAEMLVVSKVSRL